MRRTFLISAICLTASVAVTLGMPVGVVGQDGEGQADAQSRDLPATDFAEPSRRAAEQPVQPGKVQSEKQLMRLHPQHEVWVDLKRKRVIVGGQICLRQGQLEMFACTEGTKEHESIVAVRTKAYIVHTALLSIGARVGHPVRYDPVYEAAAGDRIQVEVVWRGADGKAYRLPAQQMIRNLKTRQAMDSDWVFAGSGFWKDDQTGQEYYQAEGGELLCVSNFSTATLDLPVESPRDNADLLFEAWTERIPPLKTEVRLVLTVAAGSGS